MIRGLLGVLLVTAALAAPVSVAGPPAGTLRLCADPDNLPFSSATGPERGFYLDVGALVAARLGMTVDVVWWRTFYGHRAVRNTLLAEACDAYVGLPYAAGYMDAKVSVTRPFLDVGYAIMAPRSLAFARLDDLKPRRPLAVQGPRPLPPRIEALGRQEVDAAFVWGPIAGYLNVTKFAGAYRIVPVAGEGLQWRIGIGVRKGDETLRRRIDEALAQLAPEIRRRAEHYGFPLAAAVDLTAVPPVSTTDAVAAGRSAFNQHCSHCHSPNAHSPEPARDLRRLRIRYGERMTAVFYEAVTLGRSAKGMPPCTEILKQEDIVRILSFLESVQSSP